MFVKARKREEGENPATIEKKFYDSFIIEWSYLTFLLQKIFHFLQSPTTVRHTFPDTLAGSQTQGWGEPVGESMKIQTRTGDV